jgi:branched-chain amino acid transport system permease protein
LTVRGRPKLFTSYEADASIFPTTTQKVMVGIGLLILFLLPFDIPFISGPVPRSFPDDWALLGGRYTVLGQIPVLNEGIPLVRFIGDSNWLRPMTEVLIIAIAALGLNILAGVAGQVSLGHAFFMGVGASAAAVVGGESSDRLWGWGMPIWVWLPAAGIVAATVGIIVSPIAVKLRGLYLGIVTLGLVFIGIHLARVFPEISGDTEAGRRYPEFDIRLWKEEDPLVNVSSDDTVTGLLGLNTFEVSDRQKTYFFCLVVLIVMAVFAKNLIRTRTGRALQAIRDRDIAAEVMGVNEKKYKMMAFAISSFYAGIGGAMFASFVGKIAGNQFNLFLSVEFIAILLIGGAGTVSGTLMGSFFVIMLPELVEEATEWLADQEGGISGAVADLVLTEGPGDFGPVSTANVSPGWPLNVFDWNVVIYGVLIVVFLIFEPLGLFGIWVKVKNYWKGWPFTY